MRKSKVKQTITTLLILAIAMFLIAGTYARYSTSANANAVATAAAWNIAITSGDTNLIQSETQEITFEVEDNDDVVANKVAPGVTAVATVELNLTGTEVAVDFDALIDEDALTSSNIGASYDKFSLTTTMDGTTLNSGVPQLINLVNDSAFTAENGIKTITLSLTWDNDDLNNADDTAMGLNVDTFTIPVTFTAKQHIVQNAEAPASNDINDLLSSIASVNEGGTLTLSDDLDLSEYTRIDGGTPRYMLNFADNVTFDLNRMKVSNRNFSVSYQGDNLTIKNGDFEALTIGETPLNYEKTGKGSYAIFLWDNDKTSHGVNLTDISTIGGINAYNAYDIVLDDCDVTATNFYAIFGNAKTSFRINSGTYRASQYSTALIGYVAEDDGETNEADGFKIYGGTFYTNNKPFCLTGNSYYSPVIYGGNFDVDVSAYCADGYECNYDEVSGMWIVSEEV